MNLKIAKGTHYDLDKALELDPELVKKINIMLDQMVNELKGVHTVAQISQYIAKNCDNLEEYTYAMVSHLSWHAAHGRLFYTVGDRLTNHPPAK